MHKLFQCEKCGRIFSSNLETENHEDSCPEYELGQRVEFNFVQGLLTTRSLGRITSLELLKAPDSPERVVYIRADEPLGEPEDWNQLQDGRDVWVGHSSIVRVLEPV